MQCETLLHSSMLFCCSASWDTTHRTPVSNPDLTQVTLVDLRPAKAYNLRMFAVNSEGMSGTSNVLTVTTKEAGRVKLNYLSMQKYFVEL